jgi:transcriptional regulator with XRE-family HTH domain
MTAVPDSALRKRLSVWMRAVLAERKWSAEEWAAQAQTSATNITRLLSGGNSMPTAETLARLARAAGSEPSLIGKSRIVPTHSVPILAGNDLRRFMKGNRAMQTEIVEQALDTAPILTVLYKPSPRAIAVQIETDSMVARGVKPGDYIVVEPLDIVPAVNGALVVAEVHKKIGAYLFHPPFLLAQTMTASAPIPIVDALIIGRAMHLERSLV